MYKFLATVFITVASLASAQTFGIAITQSNATDYGADVNQAIKAGATTAPLEN